MASANMKLRTPQKGTQGAEAEVLRPTIAHRAEEGLLIRQAQAGRWESFAELASRYDSPLLALALRLTSSERQACELFQEAFVRAYRELKSYRFQCSFYLWIYRIAVRSYMQFLEENGSNFRAQHMPRALDQLSPRERMVLELKHNFGLKLETVAAILETSEAAARSIFVRSVLMLRLECSPHLPRSH